MNYSVPHVGEGESILLWKRVIIEDPSSREHGTLRQTSITSACYVYQDRRADANDACAHTLSRVGQPLKPWCNLRVRGETAHAHFPR